MPTHRRYSVLAWGVLLLTASGCFLDFNGHEEYRRFDQRFTEQFSVKIPAPAFALVLEQYYEYDSPDEPEIIIRPQTTPSDSITLTLHVTGKTFQKHVQPQRDLIIQGDTLFLWYSLWRKRDEVDSYEAAGKTTDEPLPSYVMVERFEVAKPADIAVEVSHRYVNYEPWEK